MRIDIGTAAYTQALFDGLPLQEQQKNVLRGFLAERNLVACRNYIAGLPLPQNARRALEALPVLFGSYAQTLGKAKEYCINSGMFNALARLEKIYDYLLYAGFAGNVQLDFGFASRLGYYTDMVFKVYVDGALYDVIDGGRYDTLSAQFGVDRPACGFGMNINLLYEFMSREGLLANAEPSFQLAVSYEKADKNIIGDLTRWRAAGFRVAAYPEPVFLDSRDYSMHAVYRGGTYYKDGRAVTAEWLEEAMRGL